MAADILVVATPTWLGQPSSIAQRMLERLDAELSETDETGRLATWARSRRPWSATRTGRTMSAIMFLGLNDVGFNLAAQAVTYWND